MDALGFVMDNLGHFAPLDIANLLFAVLAATLLGYLLGRFGGRLPASSARELALWAAGAALGTGLVRTQLPLAVVLLALVILSRGQLGAKGDRALTFCALAFGMGCGSGASLIVLAVGLPFIVVVRWAFTAERA